jgi:HAD superfamily hydrolase (TIGR01509 family)
MDDTLIDTTGLALRVMSQAIGKVIPLSWYTQHIGHDLLTPSEWNDLLSFIGRPTELTREEFNWEVLTGLTRESNPPELIPGAAAVVESLAARSIPLAIATGAGRACFAKRKAVYPELFGRFKVVVTSSDVAEGKAKPDPESFLKAAQGLGVPPENTLVIEDVAECLVQAQKAGFATAYFVGDYVEVSNHFNIVFRKWSEFEIAWTGLTGPKAERV